jgi:hypothetical protein
MNTQAQATRSRSLFRLSLACLAACVLHGAAGHGFAQDLPFSSGSTGADGPLRYYRPADSRRYAGMAYDASRQRCVMVGGHTGGWENCVWEMDGTNWQGQFNPATRPDYNIYYHGPDSQHTTFYDTRQQRTVHVYLTDAHNDDQGRRMRTWLWDGSIWEERTTPARPPGRGWAAVAYDANRQKAVLFGGYHSQAGGNKNDTWEWDGTNWVEITVATVPPPRHQAQMWYDSDKQRVLMLGGWIDANTIYQDFWSWDVTNWTALTPATLPTARAEGKVVYDSQRKRAVLFGGRVRQAGGGSTPQNDLWEYDGTNWAQITITGPAPAARKNHAMVYDAARRVVVMQGGCNAADQNFNDTWLWNGTNWTLHSQENWTFDMTTKSNGVWNYTDILISDRVTVNFQKNAANTPVRWLASGDVRIEGNGTLQLSGSGASQNDNSGNRAPGGPGGYDGGLGGVINYSTPAGQPGMGPGGGLPGVIAGEGGRGGTHAVTYGNAYLNPLIGGSGGGGAAAHPNYGNGGNGGGGGGAILIASSKDMFVNGYILANGGGGGTPIGGGAAGGAILLRADRIFLARTDSLQANSDGRVRIEAIERTGSIGGNVTSSVPVGTNVLNQPAGLSVVSIAGQNVPQPPGGRLNLPDVLFNQGGPVTVLVSGANIPDGTPVRLRVTTQGDVLTYPLLGQTAVRMTNGLATFNVALPAGVGTVQALADYTANP